MNVNDPQKVDSTNGGIQSTLSCYSSCPVRWGRRGAGGGRGAFNPVEGDIFEWRDIAFASEEARLDHLKRETINRKIRRN